MLVKWAPGSNCWTTTSARLALGLCNELTSTNINYSHTTSKSPFLNYFNLVMVLLTVLWIIVTFVTILSTLLHSYGSSSFVSVLSWRICINRPLPNCNKTQHMLDCAYNSRIMIWAKCYSHWPYHGYDCYWYCLSTFSLGLWICVMWRWHANAFFITCPLWGESTAHRQRIASFCKRYL